MFTTLVTPTLPRLYLGIQHVNLLQYLHELNCNVHYINISNVPRLNCAACKLQRYNRDERRQLCSLLTAAIQPLREQWIRQIQYAYMAIRHFRYFLGGRSFTLFTDHKPLTFAISKISDPWSPRQQRHLSYVSEFTTDVRHIEGKPNTVADTLSRGEISAISSPQPGVQYKTMTAAQRADASITSVPTATTGLAIRDISLENYGNSISCDISTGRPRPLVPDTWQRTVFDAVHYLSHPSIRATKQLVAAKFVWPGLRKQVGIWAKTCLRCQAAKVYRHTTAPVDQFVPATRRFDHSHVDIVGPLPLSHNYRYLLTVVDRFTRWPEAIPLVDAQTITCAKALALHWIARFGVPAELTSDRGHSSLRNCGDSVSAKRHASPQDNGVPSPVEWDCGTMSSSSEICADGSPHRP